MANKKAATQTITIEIQDGLLEINDIPKGIIVVVRNYDDTEGADTTELSKDPDGVICFESVWRA